MNKIMQRALQIGLSSLVISCAACSQDAVEPADPPQQAPAAENDVADIGEGLDQQVAAAVADLAGRASVTEDAIAVREARTVNWGSGAIGCPTEGMNYTQAIVPGVLLLLEVDGKIYRYHGENSRVPFFCPDDRAEAPAYGSGEEFM